MPNLIGQQGETADGKVWARLGRVIGSYSEFVELDGIGWGDASRWEVGLGDREVFGRYVELDNARRSPKVNEEAGRAKSMSIIGDARMGGRERESILHKLYMMGQKYFFESGIKTKEGTLSKGAAEKDTWTRFGVEFVGIVGTQLGKT